MPPGLGRGKYAPQGHGGETCPAGLGRVKHAPMGCRQTDKVSEMTLGELSLDESMWYLTFNYGYSCSIS